MGQKEMLRVKLLEMVKQGEMTLKAAVVQLNISYRQGIRLYRAYRERGDARFNRKTVEPKNAGGYPRTGD
jgi:transposase